ncbi:MAG TPA: NAD(P)-dependent oxidoreductase [Gemmatimonadaceae bacterium]|nr:MAG: 3-hydroxyisobutyrate dehydrogenase [Gemmatimonadetes bacterium SCN 70-22]HMN08059.1 NAD(P)-dependent oxidoreductase [Gemmatimonadaceae bacterium]
MKIAFLGLGAIGTPMARQVAAKFPLTVWNRSSDKASAFAKAHGAAVAGTPAAAVAGADVVITCLPTSREVEALLHGSEGILVGMADGTLLIDCTSGDPASSRRIASHLSGRDIAFLDAPVSGGVSGAEAGTLTVMCGGDTAAFDRARPVLESFGRKIVLVGPVGAGHALKAVNNALLAVHIWSTVEGLAALTKAGVKPSAALEVINASSGRSNTSENLVPQRVVTRAFPRTFKLALLEKDVAIAAEFLREQRVPSAVIQQAAELFRLARHELGEDADHVEAARLIEQWSDVVIAD